MVIMMIMIMNENLQNSVSNMPSLLRKWDQMKYKNRYGTIKHIWYGGISGMIRYSNGDSDLLFYNSESLEKTNFLFSDDISDESDDNNMSIGDKNNSNNHFNDFNDSNMNDISILSGTSPDDMSCDDNANDEDDNAKCVILYTDLISKSQSKSISSFIWDVLCKNDEELAVEYSVYISLCLKRNESIREFMKKINTNQHNDKNKLQQLLEQFKLHKGLSYTLVDGNKSKEIQTWEEQYESCVNHK